MQGFGGAGISVFGNVIVSDITSVRERGKYMAIVFGTLGLGLALGPPIGGVLAETNWRWIFVGFTLCRSSPGDRTDLPVEAANFTLLVLT